MGEKEVGGELRGKSLRAFTRRLLSDIRALEVMIAEDMFESGVRRIGAEQELFLVDQSWRPALAALEVLERTDNPSLTTELGLFNLEINVGPLSYGGTCLSQLEATLLEHLAHVRAATQEMGIEPVLVGILPSMRKSDLSLDSMTPNPRYELLQQALNRLRGGAYDFNIKGLDELLVKHDTVMLEACNTSFQVHFQAAPEEFANLYNIAQVATGPVLAAAANSPLLFGRRLWAETRIALFQQAIDTRSSNHHLRERSPRVMFGRDWVRDGVLDLFREDIARFQALMGLPTDEDPFEALEAGQIPRLRALSLHNGTVYRWNRACYGVTNGRPHLRIENRVLPSGPTVRDEVANAAFWFGLISGLLEQYDDITRLMKFSDAKFNFHAAAQHGLGTQFRWLGGETLPAKRLICERLLPIAASGLRSSGIDRADAERYLGVIDVRVRSGRNGSRWLLQSLDGLKGQGTLGERMNALVAATIARQKEGHPVAEWALASIDESGGWQHNFLRVEQYMATDMFTVNEEESAELVASLMEWENIRYVPVEDNEGRLVGLVSYRALLRLLARGTLVTDDDPIPVSSIMKRDLITVAPETLTLEALDLMRRHRIGSLPVVKDERLVGIVTQGDFMDVAADLLERSLAQQNAEANVETDADAALPETPAVRERVATGVDGLAAPDLGPNEP